jgi:7-cyano-7-deazaguanine synthase in queuosine biosynthesis
MAKDLALILNNGSLNSAIATALAAQRYRPILVYVDTTGGGAAAPASRFKGAYDQQVAHFKPYREHTLSMPFLSMLQGQQATATAAHVDPRSSGLLAPQLVQLLPIVAAAVPLAAHYHAAAIYVGLRVGPGADDLARATEFVQVINELVQLPCGQGELEVQAPLLELEAWQVVEVGAQVSAPLDKGWSCVEGSAEPCGICRGCRNREAAFQQAGKLDPLRPLKR